MRVTVQSLLDLQGQTPHPAAHISVAHRDPYANTRRDHRSAVSAAVTNAGSAAPSITTHAPVGSRTSIRAGAAVLSLACGSPTAPPTASHGRTPAPASGTVSSGKNTAGIGAGLSSPARASRRQCHNCPRETSCRRATSAKTAPGACASATIRSLSSSRQRRRRSTPVIISIPTPAHNDAHKSAVMSTPIHQKQAAFRGSLRRGLRYGEISA